MYRKIGRWANIAIMPLSAIFVVLLLYSGNSLEAVTWFFIGITSYFNHLTFKLMDSTNDSRNQST